MGTNKIKIGKFGQQLAVQFLHKKGYRLVAENYYCRLGEIDIIAEDNGQLVFVEVKTRLNRNCGLPEESLTGVKKDKIERAIYDYLEKNKINHDNWRIDCIAVEIDKTGQTAAIRHHQAI